MSAKSFWLLFAALVFASSLVTVTFPRDPEPLLLTVAFWIATGAIAWVHWSGRGVAAMWRAGTGVVGAVLLWYLWDQLPRTDLYILCSRKCGPRAGTFWPTVVLCLAGIGFMSHLIWGTWKSWRTGIAGLSWRSVAWWSLTVGWIAGSGYVFARNTSWAVALESLWVAGKFVLALACVGGAIWGAFYFMTLPGRHRHKRAQADLTRFPEELRFWILSQIDEHSRRGEFQLLYRARSFVDIAIDAPKIGGAPPALAHEAWPRNAEGKPGLFLLQMPLTAPRFPAVWNERLLIVFLVDYALLIRSYSPVQRSKLATLRDPPDIGKVRPVGLQPLAVPCIRGRSENDDPDGDELSVTDLILQSMPAVRAALEQRSEHVNYVFNALLSGSPETIPWAAGNFILSGADPDLIQGPHDPECPVCTGKMRFLMQFTDVTDDHLMGDCGVGYVYGCDSHPEQCVGFVDCY